MTVLVLTTLLAIDFVYGAHPPVRTCDDLAYLPAIIVPPPVPPLVNLIGPLPPAGTLRALPTEGEGWLTYKAHLKRFNEQPMRRRGQ